MQGVKLWVVTNKFMQGVVRPHSSGIDEDGYKVCETPILQLRGLMKKCESEEQTVHTI